MKGDKLSLTSGFLIVFIFRLLYNREIFFTLALLSKLYMPPLPFYSTVLESSGILIPND